MTGKEPQNRITEKRTRRTKEQYVFDDFEAADHLLNFIITHAQMGGAVRVGLTRDGGALAIGMYRGEEYETEYVRPKENLIDALDEIAHVWGMTVVHFDDEAGVFKAP